MRSIDQLDDPSVWAKAVEETLDGAMNFGGAHSLGSAMLSMVAPFERKFWFMKPWKMVEKVAIAVLVFSGVDWLQLWGSVVIVLSAGIRIQFHRALRRTSWRGLHGSNGSAFKLHHNLPWGFASHGRRRRKCWSILVQSQLCSSPAWGQGEWWTRSWHSDGVDMRRQSGVLWMSPLSQHWNLQS